MVSPRAGLQIPAFILAFVGIVLIFVALATPSWQVVYARELQQWIKSGLWMNCQTRPNGMLSCTYTFTRNDFDFYTSAEVVNIRTPAFYEWQHHLLYVILFAQFTAFLAMVSFCLSQAPSATKGAAVFFCVAIATATLINAGANIAFQIFAHMVEYRFYHVSVSGIYEKHVGYSYFLHLAGTLLLLLSLIFSLAYAFFTLKSEPLSRENRQAYSAYQMQYRDPQEDFFAMRALPELPSKYCK